jgi:hypothetical protein
MLVVVGKLVEKPEAGQNFSAFMWLWIQKKQHSSGTTPEAMVWAGTVSFLTILSNKQAVAGVYKELNR